MSLENFVPDTPPAPMGPPGYSLLTHTDRLAVDYLVLRLLHRRRPAPQQPRVTIRLTDAGADLEIFGVISIELTETHVIDFAKQFLDVYQVVGARRRRG